MAVITARTRLGTSEVMVGPLGLGLAPIGGLYEAITDEQATAVIDRAWERGVRLFDTAPLYGYGVSERRAGLALRPRPRKELVLSTKAGRLLVAGDEGDSQGIWADPPPGVTARFDFSAGAIRLSVEESLARLGLDRLDLLHLHDPDDHYGTALREAYPALAELRGAGLVGAISVGMNQSAMLADFIRDVGSPNFDCVMVAGRYTLLDCSARHELLPLCQERGVSVLAAAVYNSGLLADPRPGARYDYTPASRPLLDRAMAIDKICQRYGVPLRAAAIQFPFGHPVVAAVVCGARTPAEVDDNADMLELPIPEELWAALKSAGLLPPDVPTPIR